MKIIVEIDGVRHKMVKYRAKNPCDVCSLSGLCANKIGYPCLDGNTHFILESKKNSIRTKGNRIYG